MIKQADVVVIGGGITGTAILYELAKYKLKAILVEREPDVAIGTTKANSAILHAGFDAPPNSWKARMNVAGNSLYHALKDELNLDIQWTGSLVVANTAEQRKTLDALKKRGEENGVPGLEIWEPAHVLHAQPNLNPSLTGALWAPTAGICWPFDLCLAFAENAILNGAEILREWEVTNIDVKEDAISGVQTDKGYIKTKYIVNAAGLHADNISAMAGDNTFTIHPRKGEYILFDKTAQDQLVTVPIFPTPTKVSKGIMVSPTIHGNAFIGPNAEDIATAEKENTAVTTTGMNQIISQAQALVPNLPMDTAITEFSGLRAVADTNDFILGPSNVINGLYQAAGIQSPGLTSAPAIAAFITAQIVQKISSEKKTDWYSGRPPKPCFRILPDAEKQTLIQRNPLFGRVICRCETITEGEIVDAIHRPVGARTVDGVKRRTRAGMGRCQGGFCGPRVIEILARELHVPISQIRKEMRGSYMYIDKEQ